MRISFLTKEAERGTRFFKARIRVVEYLRGRGHEVGIQCHPANAEYLSAFDLGLGFFYPHILPQDAIDAPYFGCVNCHIGYLPYCRGSAPNVWAIAKSLPAGVTLHIMSAGVDAGNILGRRKVEVYPTDTGETLYYRLMDAATETVINLWPELENAMGDGALPEGVPQVARDFPTYRMYDLEKLDDLESLFGANLAREFVNVLRARTFGDHEAAYVHDAYYKKVYVRVSLSYGKEETG